MKLICLFVCGFMFTLSSFACDTYAKKEVSSLLKAPHDTISFSQTLDWISVNRKIYEKIMLEADSVRKQKNLSKDVRIPIRKYTVCEKTLVWKNCFGSEFSRYRGDLFLKQVGYVLQYQLIFTDSLYPKKEYWCVFETPLLNEYNFDYVIENNRDQDLLLEETLEIRTYWSLNSPIGEPKTNEPLYYPSLHSKPSIVGRIFSRFRF